ncbi:MAG: single-stranded DNA-binding protein [Gammaproteobacteria bacterium]|nr:single-stranded DNA-binding protein [Gammaproteobacteria bacterium]
MPNAPVSNRSPSQVSDEEREQILAEAEAGDVSIAEVARRHEVNPDDVYRWRYLARQQLVAEKFLKKGALVYIEGTLQTRKWSGSDGVEKYTTEIILQGYNATLTMLDSNGGSGNDQKEG